MTEPNEFPAPDLMDSAGRLRRLVIALLVAGAAGALAYVLATTLTRTDEMVVRGDSYVHSRGAAKFVFYMAGMAFIVVFLAATAILKKRADKKYEQSLTPKAQQVRR